MIESDKAHLQRAQIATLFVEEHAKELAELWVADPRGARESVRAYRRTRDRLATLAAGCELAACMIGEKLGD